MKMSKEFSSLVDGDGEEYVMRDSTVGSLSSLVTTARTTVVAAINEIASKTPEGVISASEIMALFE